MVDRTKRNHYNANRQAGARRPSWGKDQIGGKGRGHCPHSSPFPVAMTKGSHLFPSRTQKLSPSVPKVLGWTRPGRIGRCRNFIFLSSSMAEHPAVNRVVVGSSPTWGAYDQSRMRLVFLGNGEHTCISGSKIRKCNEYVNVYAEAELR